MYSPPSTTPLNRESILREVIAVVEDMTSDWDHDYEAIGPGTCLVQDLGCESIDFVHFIVAIEEHFRRRDFPFEKLLTVDGRYVDDLTVDEVVDFLEKELNSKKGEG
jgi:acyl carrier protein